MSIIGFDGPIDLLRFRPIEKSRKFEAAKIIFIGKDVFIRSDDGAILTTHVAATRGIMPGHVAVDAVRAANRLGLLPKKEVDRFIEHVKKISVKDAILYAVEDLTRSCKTLGIKLNTTQLKKVNKHLHQRKLVATAPTTIYQASSQKAKA